MINNKKKALGVVLMALLATSCSEPPSVDYSATIRAVQMMNIELVTTKVQSFPAKVEASKQASLSFRVPGKIAKFHVRAGTLVKQGQPLIDLVPTDYRIAVEGHQADYQLAKVQHERSEALIDEQLISQDQFDQTETALKVAGNELEQAKTDLSYTHISAPYDGRVAATYFKAHEYVQALQPVMSIQSENAVDVVMEVPERLIGALRRSHLQVNQPTVSFAVKPDQQYTVSIKEIETIADPESGTFTVTMTMPSPDDLNLYPSMAATAKAELVLSEGSLTQKIPASAMMTENGQVYVWRVNADNQVEKVAIELSDQGKLLSGLLDGDRIVTAGVNELTAGQTVTEWIKERGL
ncbi:efflux RND transporter periplasmic adaptor subunit [Thalassotalea euphylliae]|uniref:Efflux RND transporter periplasmic adaptor subunit n=1 Tax=Thalassotalea euphylliae TaxID=1655234 RepID=A0A3E0TTG6_9GAMM|nr:efflux RND transporter periplasmic adaptor subunit [Thalassotalea euphylliae]REL27763.1 efflux RND transporter periplasmic adaptor subunit [Thalassotalea euphylliae]